MNLGEHFVEVTVEETFLVRVLSVAECLGAIVCNTNCRFLVLVEI